MFDLDAAVLSWRRAFARERSFSTDDLDELEDHLRAAYELELELSPSLAPARAFTHACESLGQAGALSAEFAKVEGRWWRRLLRAGQVAYGLAFLLPVARFGITLPELNVHEGGLPGVQAVLVALQSDLVSAVTAFTNLAMLASFWRIGRAGRRPVALLAALLGASAVLNLSWYLLNFSASDLYAGFYVWVTSFGVTSAGLALRARTLPAEAARERALAP